MDVSLSLQNMQIFIGQGQVSHTRIGAESKKGHAFKYPIFNLFVPIHEGTETLLQQMSLKTFFSINSENYLDGKSGPFNLLVRQFLKENFDYDPEFICLQTLPKMFGYCFNPVSFWLLYKNRKFDAVLCEVNNTFGDRHFYFVKTSEKGSSVKAHLEKRFHVSPFFPIAGNYHFHFKNEGLTSFAGIQFFMDDQLALDTSIRLELSPLAQWSRFYLLRKYGWLSLMVILRIHYQAFHLWRKKARFYSRPEPPKEKTTI